MAVKWEVKQGPVTFGSFRSGAPRMIVNDQGVTYNALASDDGLGGDELVNPDQLTEHDVFALTGTSVQTRFPQVNKTIFSWFNRTKYMCNPWLICTGKRAERDRQQKFLWRVMCDFGTYGRIEISEDDLQMIDLPATVADYPVLRETIWESDEKEIHEEATTGGEQDMRLPTGNLWAEPFVRQHPRRIIRQAQFEQIGSSDDINDLIKDRLYTLQDRNYQGDLTPNNDPNLTPWPVWKITDIQYQAVDLLGPGAQPEDPPTVLDYCYLMTYRIERTNRDGGWLDRRALIDKVFINGQGKKEAIRDETDQSVIMWGLLNQDGTLKDPQTGKPEYLNFRTQPEGQWDFLKGATP